MKKIYTLFIILLTTLSFGQTPIGLVQGLPYSEEFDGMDATSTSYIPGWTAINTNNGSPLTMAVTTGNTTTGNAYNVGGSGNDERAFGTLADDTVIPALGAVFQNNSGNSATKISIQFKMEQWKEAGNASVNEIVAFYYSLNATGLYDPTATWTPVTTLNLNEILTGATLNNAVNGNLLSNSSYPINSTINLNWANGANLWIKWIDNNDTGADGMYAIDKFSISIVDVLGLKQNTIAGLNMYPNPVSNGTLYINSNSSEAKTVEVYDLLGKQVLIDKTSNNAVNVSNLKSGSYIVKISEDGKTDTKKLIVK